MQKQSNNKPKKDPALSNRNEKHSFLDLMDEPACLLLRNGEIQAVNDAWHREISFGPGPGISLLTVFEAKTVKTLSDQLDGDMTDQVCRIKSATLSLPKERTIVADIKCLPVNEGLLVVFKNPQEKKQDFFADFGEDGVSDLLLEAIPAPVFCKDNNHIYTACNSEFLKMLGYERDMLIGRNVYEIAPSQNAKIYREADEALFEKGGRQIYETKIRYADGSDHDVVFHKSVFSDKDGKTAGLIGIILDITSRKKVERSLKENEALLQAIVNNSPAYIFVKDLEGRYIVSGNRFTDKVGWPRGFLQGKTDHEIFPPDVAHQLRENDLDVLAAGEPIAEREAFTLEKNEITNLAVKFPLYDAEGQLKGVAGIATDVSELVAAEKKLKASSKQLEIQVAKRTKELSDEINIRQQAEEELKKSASELQNILSASPVGVGISDIKEARWSFVNQSLADLLGSSISKLVGVSSKQYWKNPADRAETLQEFSENGFTKIREFEFLRADGSLFWGLLSWTRLSLDGEDKIVSWVNDISQTKNAESLLQEANEQLEERVRERTRELEKEISDRKRIEHALREREAQFEASANSTSDWFWGTDENHCFNSFSERLEEIAGINPASLLGKPRWEAQSTKLLASQWEQHIQDLNDHKAFRDFQFDFNTDKGAIRHASISGIPIFDDTGKFLGYRGAGRDITEQIKADERAHIAEQQLHQAQKMEAIGQLTGGVAHDFNNILAIILGNIDLIQDDLPESSPLYTLTSAIERSATRGAQLTQRLLAYSRKQALRPQTVNLNVLTESMLTLIDRLLGETITVSVSLIQDLHPVFADPGQIENALMNLCINSSDAMPNGGDLRIKTGNLTVDEENSELYPDLKIGEFSWLSVTDTGQGMDETTLSHAFEPFFTTKEIGKGTGLGLSMIYGFAQQSNGAIHLTSSLGEGTTATLILPAEKNGQRAAKS
ncbi:MAG: PAS domain S-box protein [Sneathiella sp.]